MRIDPNLRCADLGSARQEARSGINKWLTFYNDERLHQTLGYRTPREIFEVAPACGYVDNAKRVDHIPTGITTATKGFNRQAERAT